MAGFPPTETFGITYLFSPFYVQGISGSYGYKVLFDLKTADGLTAATAESGGQPQMSVNGGSWSNTGISTLGVIGNGKYLSILDSAYIDGIVSINTLFFRYKSGNTIEHTPPYMRILTGLGTTYENYMSSSWISALLASNPTSYVDYNKVGSQLNANYYADINLTIDNPNTDEYTVVWYRNGTAVSSGITSPTIQAVKRVDSSNLFNSTAMVPITISGTTYAYKYDATGNSRTTQGEAVVVQVTAVIDGSTRTFRKVISRDKK